MMGGVCSGIAETLGIESLYIRLLFLFLLIYAGSTLWIYLLLWLILPVLDVSDRYDGLHRFYRSRYDSMLGGVCGGLARSFRIDPTIVRLVFVGLALLGLASVFPYLLLWLVVPLEP